MKLGLGPLESNPTLDAFMFREGYDRKKRLYHPVIQCFCGSTDLEPAVAPVLAYDHYQVCQACGCLLLTYVLPEEGLGELYGLRYFREHQVAIGAPSFEVRWENDAKDRIPVWIEALQQHVKSGHVLEIGSSHGRFLKELSAIGYQVTGLELDEEVAAWAREKNGVDIRAARLETLPETNFDALFANDVLEHVYDPCDFIRHAMRVLRPGGVAFFQTVGFDTWQKCLQVMLRPLYHTILYQRKSLKLLEVEGSELLPIVKGVYGCDIYCLRKK